MFTVKSADEVFKILKDNFSGYVSGGEIVDIKDALGRILNEDILSSEDVPGFSRSTVDGFAVYASDTFGAGDTLPAQLRLVNEVRMGEKPNFSLKTGETAYIPTGGELPEGADSVVMIEYSENIDDGFIYLTKAAAPGNGVVFRGDDIKKGQLVLSKKTVLTSRHIGILAAVGMRKIKVLKKLRVGIISTGDEVIDIDSKTEGSLVRDINSWSIGSAIESWGGEPVRFGIIKDDFDEIRNSVSRALEECDLVLISGGSSVGARDEAYKVIESLGKPGILVHGIAVKPGKPTIIGKIGSKAVIGLPGHPASAYMIYKVFVEHLMEIMNGIKRKKLNTKDAVMSVNYPSNSGREEYVPVHLEESDGETRAVPVFGKSGLISMLTRADGFVRIPRNLEGLMAGIKVEVILFE